MNAYTNTEANPVWAVHSEENFQFPFVGDFTNEQKGGILWSAYNRYQSRNIEILVQILNDYEYAEGESLQERNNHLCNVLYSMECAISVIHGITWTIDCSKNEAYIKDAKAWKRILRATSKDLSSYSVELSWVGERRDAAMEKLLYSGIKNLFKVGPVS